MESMMYRFSRSTKLLKNFFKTNERIKKKVNIKFLLPLNLDDIKSTFRSEKKTRFNLVFEIGCYLIDLMWYLKVKKFNINITHVEYFENKVLKKIKGKFFNESLDLRFSLGYSNKYNNSIEIFSKSKTISINPFFWGREGEIFIKYNNMHNVKNIKFCQKDLFMEIIDSWLKNKNKSLIKDLKDVHRYKYVIYKLIEIKKLIKKYV